MGSNYDLPPGHGPARLVATGLWEEGVSVYVDNLALGYRRMSMAHMIADTSEELLEMADRIGVDRKWIQFPGTTREHFDICKSKRALAISHGAFMIGSRELVQRLRSRNDTPPPTPEDV